MWWKYLHCIATGKVGDILIRSSYTRLGARLQIGVLKGRQTQGAADSLHSVRVCHEEATLGDDREESPSSKRWADWNLQGPPAQPRC